MYKNKFFADGNSSSSENTSADEQSIEVQTIRPRPDIYHVSYKDDNDSEEDVKRIVRSEKEKR